MAENNDEQSRLKDQHFEEFKIDYQHQHEVNRAMFDSTLEAGGQTLKSLFLLNGGATVAILTFLGNIPEKSPLMGSSLFLATSGETAVNFAYGTAAAVSAMGIRYFTQYLYTSSTELNRVLTYRPTQEEHDDYLARRKSAKNYYRIGNSLNFLSISAAALSLAFFIYGVHIFAESFKQINTPKIEKHISIPTQPQQNQIQKN